MQFEFYSSLETPWGSFGIYASDQGVVRVEKETQTAPQSLPPIPYDLAHAWEAYATGLSDSLHLPLDLTASPEEQLFYLAIRKIPRGESRKLADVARESGWTDAQALSCLADCPLPLILPVHRVAGWEDPERPLHEAILTFEKEHPRLPRAEIPWKKNREEN